MQAFIATHGHTRIPKSKAEFKTLRSWVTSQRVYFRSGSLKPKHQQQLEAIGFDWSPGGERRPNTTTGQRGESPSSDARYAELLAFHAQHGHADVPTKNSANKLLGNWVSNTRISHRKGQLSQERTAQLEALGFRWVAGRTGVANSASWERRYAELLDFKQHTGHANVPSTYEANPSLATWVNTQRDKRRKGTLSAAKIEKLDAISFQWFKSQRQPGLHRSWDQHYAELVAYRQEHGHPHPSATDAAHHSLDNWVKEQRVFYRQGQLSQERIHRLNAIGFAWDGLSGAWERNLRQWQRLTQQLHRRHLDPTPGPHLLLAKWEATQRNLHRQGRLPEVRRKLLQASGMLLDAAPGTRSAAQ